MLLETVKPLCPFFGECGGCAYQDIPYGEELQIKENNLREAMSPLNLPEGLIQAIVPSPKPFHYRHRLDIALRRIKSGEVFMGFVHPEKRKTIPIDSCVIAMEGLSSFIPTLRKEAIAKFPPNYRIANLTVKTDDNGKIFWGGIGRKSLRMKESDYFWTVVDGTKIYYSLDTFFQANLAILPLLRRTILENALWNSSTTLFDLYGGVGLFSMMFARNVSKVILIEESPSSIKGARYNIASADFKNVEILEGKVEEILPLQMAASDRQELHALIDPPRRGLSEKSREFLSQSTLIKSLFYLSCNPQTLKDDLKVFLQNGWQVQTLIPFDFFPKTVHLEVLTLMTKHD